MTTQRAFTFIEVLAILLLVGLGLTSILGLVLFATKRSETERLRSLGLATAMTVAYDDQPLLSAEASGDWNRSAFPMDSTGATTTVETKGYINGFYIIRTESGDHADNHTSSSGTTYARPTRVQVRVYSYLSGSEIAAYACTLTRQRGAP
jgi:type II secretory pathway pseudopilin PulG